MNSDRLDSRDFHLLTGIKRGPGNYPTPSPSRISRLMERGLIKHKRTHLALTLKGRLVNWLSRPSG